jgi:hypothetical protein
VITQQDYLYLYCYSPNGCTRQNNRKSYTYCHQTRHSKCKLTNITINDVETMQIEEENKILVLDRRVWIFRVERCSSAHLGPLGCLWWYRKIIHRLAASSYLPSTLKHRLWPDEVQFGLAASTISCRAHSASRDVRPIMYGNIAQFRLTLFPTDDAYPNQKRVSYKHT